MLVVFIVYAPTNSGLRFVRERGLERIASRASPCYEFIEARGEEIPRLVRDAPGTALGITGEDLVMDYAGTQAYPVQDPLGLAWQGPYANSVFGLPTLAILSRNGQDIGTLGEGPWPEPPDLRGKRAAIPRRYERLVRSFLDLEGAYVTALDGKVDVAAAKGFAEYAIDIVLSGRTARENGLGVHLPPLFSSDGVIIGNAHAATMYAALDEKSGDDSQWHRKP